MGERCRVYPCLCQSVILETHDPLFQDGRIGRTVFRQISRFTLFHENIPKITIFFKFFLSLKYM